MRSTLRSKLMPMRKAILFTMMVAFLFLEGGCAVQVKDMQFCSPIPGDPPGELGAVCDWFLHSDQKILTKEEWIDWQQTQIKNGSAVECTTSATLGDIKAEIEKLCSKVKCDYQTQQAIVSGLQKLQSMGEVTTFDKSVRVRHD